MTSERRRDLPTDPWFARLIFQLLDGGGPWWVTLWLALVLGGAIGLAIAAGPWAPGVVAAVGALTAGGAATAKGIAARSKAKSSRGDIPPG